MSFSSFFLSLDLLEERRPRSLERDLLLLGLRERLRLRDRERLRDLLPDLLCRERERDLLRLDLDLDLERECLRLLSFLLPGSIAAEMSDCASRTLFMASSISLLEASDFRPMLAAIGFIVGSTDVISFRI